MANPTSAFGWQMPTSTDLVTDLPADFETFGQAVDTSLADLKGGTTGQVLSKASNTDMDFTWVAQDDSNAIQNAIVDAKGDLIAASAADTPARLAVGNNGETLVADSSQTTGLRYNPQNALVNPVIGGGFDIWQRGTSFAVASATGTYTADRWQVYRGAAGTTISRQLTGDTTNLPNVQYCARVQRNSGNTATNDIYFFNNFESVNSIPYAGKVVTVSFYARAGSNYSAASSNLSIIFASGTGTDQNFVGGYTGQINIVNSTATLTTTWQRFAYTGTVPATATELGIQFGFTAVGTAGTNDFYEVTGVQIDLGTYTASTAPTFRRSGGTIQGELSACQRYYYRFTNTTANPSYLGIGTYYSTTTCYIVLQWPVTMRIAPTIATSSQTGWLTQAGSQRNSTAFAVDVASTGYADVYVTTSSHTLGIGAVVGLLGSSNHWVEASAEL